MLRINLHTSAAYASLVLTRERRLLEQAVPGLAVEWKAIPTADAVNTALADGGLDLAVGPPTAFLQAREAGVPARLLAGLCALPCAIVTRGGLRGLDGLGPLDRVAVPEETGFEAAVLEFAALHDLGDPWALAGRTVFRGHAEALPLMKLGTDLAAHVSVTPYLEQELDGPGPRALVDSRALFGTLATTALAYGLPAAREPAATLVRAFTASVNQAARTVAADPLTVAGLLGEADELRLQPARLGAILARSRWQPGPTLAGVMAIAELWRRTDRLRRTPVAWAALAADGVAGD